MTYTETVDLIQGIAEDVNPNGTFIHGRRVDSTLSYDEPMPQIHLYPFITNLNLDTGFDSSNIVIGFWQQGGAELSMDEAKEKISAAYVMCKDFLDDLYETNNDISNVRIEPGYNLFSALLTGYTLTFTLTSKTSSC